MHTVLFRVNTIYFNFNNQMCCTSLKETILTSNSLEKTLSTLELVLSTLELTLSTLEKTLTNTRTKVCMHAPALFATICGQARAGFQKIHFTDEVSPERPSSRVLKD